MDVERARPTALALMLRGAAIDRAVAGSTVAIASCKLLSLLDSTALLWRDRRLRRCETTRPRQ